VVMFVALLGDRRRGAHDRRTKQADRTGRHPTQR
jgi:hypothetical protein